MTSFPWAPSPLHTHTDTHTGDFLVRQGLLFQTPMECCLQYWWWFRPKSFILYELLWNWLIKGWPVICRIISSYLLKWVFYRHFVFCLLFCLCHHLWILFQPPSIYMNMSYLILLVFSPFCLYLTLLRHNPMQGPGMPPMIEMSEQSAPL